ncbi:hypothetical protein M2281_001371 [Mesorhizobium soli]|nr:hypothetical protein [Mesorhizobium soli]
MARLRGRAPRGERCRAGVPHGHWKTTTFTGALRLTGMTAPFVYDGAMNGNVFLAYVEQVLVPTLSSTSCLIGFISSGSKVVCAFGWAEQVESRADGIPQSGDRPFSLCAQQRLEF